MQEPAHQEVLHSLKYEMAELLILPEQVEKEKFYQIVAKLQGLQVCLRLDYIQPKSGFISRLREQN